ncbi:MAG: C40 family peptidase [Gammaproteobacteria bacterium]|nr:C40 family peptidase [Gammaproteobacteria bacterium]MDH3507341.1 C40 family peptidase [Gammaproteobacteria bacterium]
MRFSELTAVFLIASLVLLAGCAGAPARPTAVAAPSPHAPAQRLDRGERAALIAREQIGIQYRYGGMNPATGFDCSGLVYYSYTQAGITVPRTSSDQFRAARKISLADAQPGDVVFFQDQEKLSHVGIYLGQRRFIHAPSSGRTVSVANIDSPYYQEHLVAVGRLTSL